MKKYFQAIMLAIFAGGSLMAVAIPTDTYASCNSGFLGFPAWYDGVTNSDCTIDVPNSSDGKAMSNFVWRIALNILQIAITAVAYLSAFYIIYGGFQYLLSRGSSDGMKKGKNAILNAVIGLVIALMAIAVVGLIINGLGLGVNESIPDIDANTALANTLSLVYFAAGIIAVIAIITAGFMYAISRGDVGEIAKAKMAILYAVAGLIIVSVAFVITNFVLGRF